MRSWSGVLGNTSPLCLTFLFVHVMDLLDPHPRALERFRFRLHQDDHSAKPTIRSNQSLMLWAGFVQFTRWCDSLPALLAVNIIKSIRFPRKTHYLCSPIGRGLGPCCLSQHKLALDVELSGAISAASERMSKYLFSEVLSISLRVNGP